LAIAKGKTIALRRSRSVDLLKEGIANGIGSRSEFRSTLPRNPQGIKTTHTQVSTVGDIVIVLVIVSGSYGGCRGEPILMIAKTKA